MKLLPLTSASSKVAAVVGLKVAMESKEATASPATRSHCEMFMIHTHSLICAL